MVPSPVEEAMDDDVLNAGVDIANEPIQAKGTSRTLLDHDSSLYFYAYVSEKKTSGSLL